ncbi:hypothetical protein Cpap_0455 [Ruminiclostridium papyrosolvens DSM 2782]|uniref:Uncharacterized protein n=1 Tax=Ruminiclostridium papyrosolvens DSM 2782 TaxID=588581 RepID=F1THF8_9FIRM|nr:hypothetical protein Cpap_0455 [Ruminiclostridium papyrosolvens DSM 2782]
MGSMGYELMQTREGRIVFILLVIVTVGLLVWDKKFSKKH